MSNKDYYKRGYPMRNGVPAPLEAALADHLEVDGDKDEIARLFIELWRAIAERTGGTAVTADTIIADGGEYFGNLVAGHEARMAAGAKLMADMERTPEQILAERLQM